jgi:hypothetical protein
LLEASLRFGWIALEALQLLYEADEGNLLSLRGQKAK